MTDRPEFRPIESVPARRVWPYAVLGAIAVAALVFVVAHRGSTPAAAESPQALANLAPKIDAAQATAAIAQPMRNETLAAASKPSEGPNVIGAAMEKAKTLTSEKVKSLTAVARGEVDRESARTKSAQKQAEQYRKQNADLQQQLDQARSQIAALQQAKKGPPPSDQEQILQMLAPVLKTSSNDGRP
jgi:hypothetical protein